MRTLIVDDERLARAELTRLLRDLPSVEVVAEARHVDEAVSQIERHLPDLVFLDIAMPGGDGFDVLDRLEDVPLVVFTTAFEAHAVRAFQVNALDYLLKPIEPARLCEAVGRAEQRLGPRPGRQAAAGPARCIERIFVRDGDLCLVVDFKDVVLFESEGNYTRLYLGPGPKKQPLVPKALSYLEQRLDPRAFFRANRQEMVNLARVTRFEPAPGAGLVLTLENGRAVEMSRRQAQRFRQLMSV